MKKVDLLDNITVFQRNLKVYLDMQVNQLVSWISTDKKLNEITATHANKVLGLGTIIEQQEENDNTISKTDYISESLPHLNNRSRLDDSQSDPSRPLNASILPKPPIEESPAAPPSSDRSK